MITKRQESILKIIVQEFIKTVQPVGSKKIMELINIKISSATIRNESALLEERGYLEKQHTSSGRIPSTKGYRYYVDFLMSEDDIDEKLREELSKLMQDRTKSIDTIINQATLIISEMTRLTAIVSTKDVKDVVVKKIDLIPLTTTTASVIFVLSNGIIQKKIFNLDNISLKDLAISIKLFSDILLDQKITSIQAAVQVIKPNLETNVKDYEYILQSFVNAIVDKNQGTRETYGISYMLDQPEFNNTEKLKAVIKLMERISPFDWYDMRYSSDRQKKQIATAIGEENSGEFKDIGVVGAEFETLDGKKTAITLVGPKRMNYNQANQLIKWLIEMLAVKNRR